MFNFLRCFFPCPCSTSVSALKNWCPLFGPPDRVVLCEKAFLLSSYLFRKFLTVFELKKIGIAFFAGKKKTGDHRALLTTERAEFLFISSAAPLHSSIYHLDLWVMGWRGERQEAGTALSVPQSWHLAKMVREWGVTVFANFGLGGCRWWRMWKIQFWGIWSHWWPK